MVLNYPRDISHSARLCYWWRYPCRVGGPGASVQRETEPDPGAGPGQHLGLGQVEREESSGGGGSCEL